MLTNPWVSRIGNLVVVLFDMGIVSGAYFPPDTVCGLFYGLPKCKLKATATLMSSGGPVNVYIESNSDIIMLDGASATYNITGFLHGQLVYITSDTIEINE